MKGTLYTSHLSRVCAQTHTHTSMRMHRLNSSIPSPRHTHTLFPSPHHPTATAAAGLFQVSVISCSARLNYDVNKSTLDQPHPIHVGVGARPRTCTLASASLCGLLFFDLVTSQNILTYKINSKSFQFETQCRNQDCEFVKFLDLI